MNMSYEKNKSLKDIETKFKKYSRTKKNRFIRYIINLFHKLVNRLYVHPLQKPCIQFESLLFLERNFDVSTYVELSDENIW